MEIALKDTEVFKVPEEKRAMPPSREQWERKHQLERLTPKELAHQIDDLNEQMIKLARELKFEEAAAVRDKMQELQQALKLMPGNDEV